MVAIANACLPQIKCPHQEDEQFRWSVVRPLAVD